jgi:NAD(P)H dehydrogenase (quinone)
MYTIMGITGRTGGATARALLKAGKQVRGLVRNKAKAASWEAAGVELVVADYDDPAALGAAFCDAEGIFAIIPPNFAPAPGYPEARAFTTGLRKAIESGQPKCAVYLSSVGAHRENGLGLITQCRILEQELVALSVPNAFIRAAWFIENSQWDVGSAREKGEIASFLNPLDRPFPMVATEDIGNLAAQVLQQDWTGNRYIELEGPRRYSQLDAARTWARLLNRSVVANPIPCEKWDALFQQEGMAPDRTSSRIEMLDGFNSGWIDFERVGTEHVQGTCTLEQTFKRLLEKAE